MCAIGWESALQPGSPVRAAHPFQQLKKVFWAAFHPKLSPGCAASVSALVRAMALSLPERDRTKRGVRGPEATACPVAADGARRCTSDQRFARQLAGWRLAAERPDACARPV